MPSYKACIVSCSKLKEIPKISKFYNFVQYQMQFELFYNMKIQQISMYDLWVYVKYHPFIGWKHGQINSLYPCHKILQVTIKKFNE